MKKPIILFFILILIMSSSALATNFNDEDILKDMILQAENQYLKLYINEVTTAIAVKDKTTKNIWYSNPPNFAEHERVLGGSRREQLGSQLKINYDPRDVSRDNYSYSIKYEQFSIKDINNGVRIDYDIVEEWDKADYIPHLINKEEFEELLGLVENERDKDFLKQQYELVEMRLKTEDSVEVDISSINMEDMFGDYELIYAEKDNISASQKRDLIWKVVEKIRDHSVEIESVRDMNHNNLVPLIDNPTYIFKTIPPFLRTRVADIIISTGFTPIDVERVHSEYRIDPPLLNLEHFKIPLEYHLEGDNLIVRIPASEIEYPVEVEDLVGNKHTFPLLNIDVLPYFGAAGGDKEGYILVPDGSGALIYLNNDKQGISSYQQWVYGRDNTIFPSRQESIAATKTYSQQVHLPVFGLKEGDKAFFAIIEKSDALARIRASVAGQHTSYNTVSAQFTTIPKGSQSFANIHRINLYATRLYQGDIQLRYKFFGDETANYGGMAQYYQKYLTKKHKIEPLNPENNIPFYLDLIGAVTKQKSVFGLPREVTERVSSFTDVKKITEELLNKGLDNLTIRYLGWSKGGINHVFPKEVSLENKLGTEKQFLDLIEYLQRENIGFYPDISFLNIYQNNRFDGFSPNKYSARQLNYDIARNQGNYILSPRKLENVMTNFLDDYQKYNINGLSLRYLGNQLNSDPRQEEEKTIDRQQALDITIKQLEKTRDSIDNLIFEGGNSYVFPYTRNILNVPLSSTGFNIIDEDIPFYQMVVRGFIDYAGPPINLVEDNLQKALLRYIDYGAYPYYILSYGDDPYLLKETNFNQYYASNYYSLIDSALDYYFAANEVLKHVYGKRIIERQKIADNIYQTFYENDYSIVVNYNEKSFDLNGTIIEGYSFKLISGGSR